MTTKILVIILLSVFAILAISSMRQNSATCDEIAHHIPVGYVLLTKWDFKMDTSQPPLPRYIVALPLKLFMNINMPDDKAIWRVSDRSIFGRDFFYKYNNDQVRMVFFARMAVVFIGILCGLLLFIWSKSLWGYRSALFSLFLYALSPDMLAHSGLATTDMVATFFIFLSCYSFWLFLKDSSFKNVIFSGICLGLAELSKYTAILLYPAFLLILLFELFGIAEKLSLRGLRAEGEAGRSNLFFRLLRPGVYTERSERGARNDEPRRAFYSTGLLLKFLLVVLLSLIIIWAGYGFEFQPLFKDAMRLDEKLQIAHSIAKKLSPHISQGAMGRLDDFLLKVPVPLGSHMLGIMGVFKHGYEGHKAFFLGKWSTHGSPFYFLVAFLIKTPIPMLIFLALGIIISLRRKLEVGEKFILVVTAIFFITSSLSGLKIGLRHILPIYPFCFMMAGRSGEFLQNRFLKLGAGLLMLWYAFTALTIWPHYLGYFNEIIGGSKYGYKYLRDSNFNWGQDLPALADYMNKNKSNEVILLDYVRQADPVAYGVHYRNFTSEDFKIPQNKVYAISADVVETVDWAKDREPTAKAGYSIFIYDFTKEATK